MTDPELLSFLYGVLSHPRSNNLWDCGVRCVVFQATEIDALLKIIGERVNCPIKYLPQRERDGE